MLTKLRKHGVLMEHTPFGPGSESDIEEDEPDEPGDSNMSMSQFEDENNAKLASSSLADPDLAAAQEQNKKEAAEARNKVNEGDPHQLKRCQGYVVCYADDLIICSSSAEEHKKHILDLFRILSEERIYLQPAKSKLFCKYVRYLGMVCGNDMLLEDPLKIRSIVKMPAPKESQSEVRGFIGMASFWRKFIPDFAGIIHPLNSLLLKGVNVKTQWGPQHDEAVFNIKKALVSYPVLRHFAPGKPAFVYTDASKYAIGGFLGQKDDEGNIYVISYVSRALHGAELNYSVQEQECLGIVFCGAKVQTLYPVL